MIGFSAQDWHDQASAAAQGGDLVAATAALKSGLSAYPDEAMLWHGAGSVFLSQGNPREAAEHFAKAHELEPQQFDHGNDQKGWLELGRPPAGLGLDWEPLRYIKPKAGHLALYPSTLYHNTAPFEVAERLTVAFDVASEPR